MTVNWNQLDYPDVWLTMQNEERIKWLHAIRNEGTATLEVKMDQTRIRLLKDARAGEITIATFKNYEIVKLMKGELQSRYNKNIA